MTSQPGLVGALFTRCLHSAVTALTVILTFGLGSSTPVLAGTTLPYVWTGLGNNNYLYDTGNWANDLPPPSTIVDLNSDILGVYLVFGDSRRTYTYYDELYASQITFSGITHPYYLEGEARTTHIGSGGIIYAPEEPFWSTITGPIQLHASQTWNIASGTLNISGAISDSTDSLTPTYGNYEITKTGAGTLRLNPTSSFSWAGGLRLSEGLVVVSPAYGYTNVTLTSLGMGTLTFDGGALAVWRNDQMMTSSNDVDLSITNDIVSKGTIAISSDYDLTIANAEVGSNTVRLDADTVLKVKGSPLFIEKTVTDNDGNHKLTVDSPNLIVLYGASDWTGGTEVIKGDLIFGGTNNLPVGGNILVGANGYVGIGVDNNVTQFLGKVDLVNSTGSIGFDSDLSVGTSTFTSPIDLTGANASLRLGSATAALLDPLAVITPQGSDYRFGGGGGTLIVASALTDGPSGTRNVVVESPMLAPLTLELINTTNSFTGTVTANDSAVVFEQGVPLPAGTANFIMNSGGYIGSADSSTPVETFLSHFSANTTGIIGFDTSHNVTTSREVSNLSMEAFAAAYVGTTTALYDTSGNVDGPGLILSGTIGPNSDGVHRFAAFKGGALMISGTLTGNSAIIGLPDSLGAFGDRTNNQRSIVYISGDNTNKLTNGVTLYGGELIVAQGAGTPGTDPSTALGSGTLTIQPVTFSLDDGDPEGKDVPTPLLNAAATDLIIGNDMVLNTELQIGGNNALTLAGTISGSGGLLLRDEYGSAPSLTLSGSNTFTGGLSLDYGSSVHLTSDQAAGQGPMQLEYGTTAYFESSNPVVHGLASEGGYATINLNNSTAAQVLTIYQQDKGYFYGQIYGSGASTVVKDGPGLLTLDGTSISTSGIADGSGNDVSLEVRNGTLLLQNNTYVTSGTVKVAGGTLALGGNNYLGNAVVVNSGGRLAGYGYYGANVSIGNGAIISPGLAEQDPIGLMHFNHLELNAGGIYEYNVQDPDSANIFGQDRINVEALTTLVINATALDPFIIKVISLDANSEPGTLVGIDPNHGTYSWVLFDFYTLSIPGTNDEFLASLFSLDLSAFTSDALMGGDFELVQSGNQIMLNFTPVPEPSTYALMALGLALVVWTLRRRRAA